MNPRVGVLALQGDVGRHASILDCLGATPLEVRVPRDLADIDAVVIPGGESTTMSVLLRSTGLLQPLRSLLAEGLPAFGTCAGLILLATDVVGGREDQEQLGVVDMTVRRNAFGRQVDSFETDLEVSGVAGGPLHAVFIRAPGVERVGPEVEVLASIHAGAEQVPVVCRQGPVLVASFHPELAGDPRLHQLFLGAPVPAAIPQ